MRAIIACAAGAEDVHPFWVESRRRSHVSLPVAMGLGFRPARLDLLDESLQPHLGHMQHGSVDDPSSHRLVTHILISTKPSLTTMTPFIPRRLSWNLVVVRVQNRPFR